MSFSQYMRGEYVQNRGIEISMHVGTTLKIPIIPVPQNLPIQTIFEK
jgi:hypothetical protein